ncbi:hypothetical protein GMORB2_2107 [Geosmithia morbida]|uniref:C2H2-type domain-containing protein n=1 Tax=Geosmithia morbida TaxID=1094350 RepID=A0A9P5D2U1_9HYPO|nr:uncharacterized protein GMORB2_2107 [Geosmithia morbida]KAF4121145.1 hypothetical protein GMORB2_2107 [Geosmithia morbida]
MSKRTAIEEAQCATPLKRIHLEQDGGIDATAALKKMHLRDSSCHRPITPPPAAEDEAATPTTSPSNDEEEGGSPAEAAAYSSPVTTTTTTTTTTTPSHARFPSDLKTLCCTWPGCPKTFNRPARLRDHLNSHTNSRPFRCLYDGCDKDYTVDKHLKQHVKAVHTRERKHVCPRDGCGKSFVTGTRLKRHQAVHEGADRFRCPECGQSFRKRDTLAKHVRRDHRGLPTHACPETGCDAAFDTRASLRRHADRQHGEPRFWCAECASTASAPLGFTTQALLQAHIKRDHQDCIFCDFKSTSQAELERHVELHHSGRSVQDRRSVRCPHPGCPKTFTRRSNCNNHVRTAHQGLRYVCGQVGLPPSLDGQHGTYHPCGQGFASKARLEDHVRHVHLGQERVRMSAVAPDPDLVLGSEPGFSVAAVGRGDGDDASAMIDDILGMTDAPTPMFDAGNDFTPSQLSTGAADGEEEEAGTGRPDDDEYDENIFAADLDYDDVDNDWADDEANILLLARHDLTTTITPSEDAIDPSLGHF